MRLTWRLAFTLGVLAMLAEDATPVPAQIVVAAGLVLVLAALWALADLGEEQ